MRAHWNAWGRVSQHMEFGLRKGQRGLDAFIVIRDSGMDTSRCADKLLCFQCACTVVFPLQDQSRQSWHHEMMSQGSLMLFWEGNIKREHTRTSELSSGSSDTECLGLLTSHRPSTLAISVSLVEQSITRINCVFHLSICTKLSYIFFYVFSIILNPSIFPFYILFIL